MSERALYLRFREPEMPGSNFLPTSDLLWDCERGWLSSSTWVIHMNEL